MIVLQVMRRESVSKTSKYSCIFDEQKEWAFSGGNNISNLFFAAVIHLKMPSDWRLRHQFQKKNP